MSISPTAPKSLFLVVGLILIAAASRLLPHPSNFVPVGAMALFGAAALPKRWLAIVVPVLAFYLSDLVLNNTLYAAYFDGFYWGVSYWMVGAIVLMVLLGMGLLRNLKFSWLRVGGAAVGATLVFFLVTNFGTWAGGMLYPKTGAGLLAAFAAGLPFLLNSLLANLVFSGLLFGAARWAGVLMPQSTNVLQAETIDAH
ncbi:DUF6580 family putative transport protein [Neolewinella persica]|uniref:DUF6580 family putative transport protein n=1 Tax=Neolewinella persica TaxID=70998 RepID=UPI000364A2C0|nr:DUF6580 family putative transport protein [Neolewinella persica]